MPNCFVKNCKNRTSHIFNQNVMFYTFPQDPDLRSKWLEACQKDIEYKNKDERICEVHFKSGCIEEQMTKPRSKDVEPRVIRRLKKGSIPTEFLNLPNERCKRLYSFGKSYDSNDVEPSQKLVRSGIPTYAELVGCTKNSTEKDTIPESTAYTISDITTDTDPCVVNASTTEEHVPMKIDFGQENKRQTDQERKPENIEHLLALVKELKKENTQLANKNLQLQATLREKCNRIEDMKHDIHNSGEKIAADILHTVFTSGQVKKIVSTNKSRIKWTIEDITSAIALRSVSARVYNYLREIRKIPLPCVATLRNWVADFKVKPGILHEVLKIMEIKGNNLTTAQKLAVLTFDEVYISNKVDLERREQQIYGPHKTCQVVMICDLFLKWKQPIFYEYSKLMTKDILFEIIETLYKIGYIVVATTSDMGPTNMSLWKQLNVGITTKTSRYERNKCREKQCFFLHPADNSLKVFVFADVLHLIKLLRNNLFDSGFNIDGQTFDTSLLEELIQLNSKDLKIAFNLSRAHLDAKGFQRQRVKLAAQVFSLRNAKALEYCGKKGFLSKENWKEMSNMLKLINDWFDILNTQSKFGQHSGLRAYGVDLDKQNQILEDMNEFILKMRVANKTCLMPFQKGILLTNNSLKQLLAYIKDNYSDENFQPQYIITRKLCQDVLENFFSYLRAMGAANDHPSPVEFRNRLKWYILGKHSEHAISVGGNTEIDNASEPLFDLHDVHSESSCESHIFNEIEEEELAKEAALFIGNSSFQASQEETDEEEEKDEEGLDNDGILSNCKLLLLDSCNF